MVLVTNLVCAMAQKTGNTGPLTWSYNEDSKELKISGKGDMPNYDFDTSPWKEYKEQIELITIGDDVTAIGNNAFCNCFAITEINIPSKVTRIGESAFTYCISLEKVVIPGSVRIIDYGAFEDCEHLTTLTLSNGLESIEGFAFKGCNSIESLVIPTTVTNIGRWSFSGCETIQTLKIPGSVKTIGDNAFSTCINLVSLELPEGLETIDEAAFNGCEKLPTVLIPASTTTLGGGVFADCKGMTQIKVAQGNPSYIVENDILYDINKRHLVQYPAGKTDATFTIPSNVEAIDKFAFCGNEHLTSVTIHPQLESIGYFSFARCNGISTFNVPAKTQDIGESAFHDCISLTAINIDKDNPNYVSIDGVLYDKSKYVLMQYPTGKTDAAYVAPSTLKILGNYAFFSNSNITSIDLPDGLTRVGDFAFGWCRNLGTLTVRVTEPENIEVGLIPFFRGSGAVTCTLRVPQGSKEKYESVQAWADFAPNIEELESTGIEHINGTRLSITNSRTYDLRGILMNPSFDQLQKGIYIVDGKKIIKR